MDPSELELIPPIVRVAGEKYPMSFLGMRGQTPLVLVSAENLVAIARFLRDEPGLEFNYLSSITAVDYWEYFEVAYLLQSIHLGQTIELKVRVDRETPVVPSVVDVWKGANLQEREVYDLMGVEFSGHPDLTRVLLWEGFPGHPLRKDFDLQPDDIPIPKDVE